ncbi:hypothetical protein BZL30_8343 [Mycobacterium kansasii]|uniref:Uncharacterized protein n=1 Tax=Mycobacterium kansasii TaxID=1768 RepID=A0A1V3WI49_MYCKA|nr:hypothetical protein BZL30_8343 [Mycobacterium kansasii]
MSVRPGRPVRSPVIPAPPQPMVFLAVTVGRDRLAAPVASAVSAAAAVTAGG